MGVSLLADVAFIWLATETCLLLPTQYNLSIFNIFLIPGRVADMGLAETSSS